MPHDGPFALVTGASSGIGEAIARQLAEQRIHPIIHGRDPERTARVAKDIQSVHGFEPIVVLADLDSPGGIQQILDVIGNRELNVLVNNAGYTCWGAFGDLGLSNQLGLIHTQVNAMVMLTHQLLPAMKKLDKAYVLNVASTTIYQPIPNMAVYGATKAFTRYFSRAIRQELKSSSVNVTTLIPGTTDSRFMERAEMQALEKIAAKFSMPADRVARAGLAAMFAEKAEVIPGTLNWLSAKLSRILPTSLTIKLAAGIYQLPERD
jgi:short-subunit dehydrogenase